jgi:CHAD domain-containing protein
LTPELLARSARYSARRIARDRLRHVLDVIPTGEAAQRADALHDFRVGLRRLRSWLRAFRREVDDTVGPGSFRRLRRLSRRTGRARDLEVQLAWLTQPTVPLGPLATRAAAAMAERVRAEHASARAAAYELIRSEFPETAKKLDKRLRRFEVRLDSETAGDDLTMAAVLGPLLRRSGARVRQALAAITTSDAPGEAHRARLAVKHLRYLVEALGDWHRSGPEVARHLAALQDALGRLHDRHLLLAGVGTEAPSRGQRALQAALGRAASAEFRRAMRLVRHRRTAATLERVERLAGLLSGDAARAPGLRPIQTLADAETGGQK